MADLKGPFIIPSTSLAATRYNRCRCHRDRGFFLSASFYHHQHNRSWHHENRGMLCLSLLALSNGVGTHFGSNGVGTHFGRNGY